MTFNRKITSRTKIHRRIRSRVSGSSLRPRLFVFRSNQHIYANLIDDQKRVTLVFARDSEIKDGKTKTDKALLVGELIAKKALEKKINEVVFDRGGYLYHGRVKQVAEGARKGGLKF
jgi:large subunit ribosomal protein L18